MKPERRPTSCSRGGSHRPGPHRDRAARSGPLGAPDLNEPGKPSGKIGVELAERGRSARRGAAGQLSQFLLRLPDASPAGCRQAAACSVLVEVEHRHGGAKGRRFSRVASLGRTLQRLRHGPGLALEDSVFERQRMTAAGHGLRPAAVALASTRNPARSSRHGRVRILRLRAAAALFACAERDWLLAAWRGSRFIAEAMALLLRRDGALGRRLPCPTS